MSSGDLAHYGVKGMKWGVHKKPLNSNYTQAQQQRDRKDLGRRSVKKVSRRMDKGETHDKARKKVYYNMAMRNLVIAGALYATPRVLNGYDMTRGSVAQRAQAKRGQAAAAAAMGLPRNASKGPSYAKRNRSGAYKISNV